MKKLASFVLALAMAAVCAAPADHHYKHLGEYYP